MYSNQRYNELIQLTILVTSIIATYLLNRILISEKNFQLFVNHHQRARNIISYCF